MRLTPVQAVDVALDYARTLPGVIECFADVSHDTSATLRWANNTLTTNSSVWDNSFSVVVFVSSSAGVSHGVVGGNDSVFDAAYVRSMVDRAVVAARAADPVADAPAFFAGREVGVWDAPALLTDPSVFAGIAPQLGAVLGSGGSLGRNHSGYAEHARSSSWLGSLGGLRLRHDSVGGRVEMTARSFDGVRSSWEGVNARSFDGLDVLALDAKLGRRLKLQESVRKLGAGRYTTILPAGATADLFTSLDANLSGRDAVEGSGAFSLPGGRTRLGERLTDRNVNLFSDPSYAGVTVADFCSDFANSSTSSVFDVGGPVGRTDWIRDGVLTNLCTSRVSAAETGLPYVPDVSNLVLEVEGGHGSLDDVIARTESGLLLTCLWYIRDLDEATMMSTGTTRDGVYEVRDGEIVGAVNNFRFNESPLSALARIRDAGAAELAQPRENAEYVSDFMAPVLVIDDFNMSSVSEAN